MSTEFEEWRLVVLGAAGNGKSSSINTIFGKNIRPEKCSSRSVTQKCQLVDGIAHGKRLIIVDTPGLFDTDVAEDETVKEIGKTIAMTAPGLHAFIVVFKIGRFTKEEIRSVEIFTKLFGSELYERAVVLFTGVDNLEVDGVEFKKYVESIGSFELRQFIIRCNNRVVGFNNRNRQDKRQVECLMRIIGDVVMAKKKMFCTNEMYQEAARIVREGRLEAGNTKIEAETQRETRRDISGENTGVIRSFVQFFRSKDCTIL